jgi:Lipocalin-like domain
MRKIIVTTFIFFISLNVQSQNTKLIVGKWIFKEALNKEVDELGRKTLNEQIINKMTYEFKSNGEFIMFAMGENSNGKWSIPKAQNSIILLVGKDKMVFKIIKLTAGELILKAGFGKFLMKRL